MQTEINTILVPTDFSPKSNNALKVAVKMAKRHEAKLILVHMVHTFYIIDKGGKQVVGSKVVEDTLESAQVKLEQTRIAISDKYNLAIETHISTQNLVDTVNEFILKKNIDLVILGSSGQQTYKEFFLGSNSYNVLLHANCSILLIPEKFKKTIFKNILLPIRVTHELQQKSELSLLIARKNEGEIYLLGIGKEEPIIKMKNAYGEIKKALYNESAEYSADFKITANSAEMIAQEAIEKNCDIILIADRDEDSWKSFMAENFFKKIINSTDIPLLFVKSKLKRIKYDSTSLENYDLTLPIPG